MKDYRIKLSYTIAGYPYERISSAVFGDEMTVEYNRQSNEQYYTERLNGKITFTNADYNFIMGTAIDQRIDLTLEYYEYGAWWTYIQCYFYRTDCEINVDDKIIVVEPTTADKYAEFLGALDKEVDLVKLAPRITPVMLDKRPCLQLYALGQNSISCLLSNMAWEQDCEEITDSNALTQTYHFANWGNYVSAGLFADNFPSGKPTFYSKKLDAGESLTNFSITNGQYVLSVAPASNNRIDVRITQSGNLQWQGYIADTEWGMPITMDLTGWNGNPNCKIEFANVEVFGRLISDVDSILGVDTFDLPNNDLVGNNRNYKKVSPIPPSGDLALAVNGTFSASPTEWGLYQTGQYYTTPVVIGGGEFHPVLRNSWGRTSYWVMQSTALDYVEQTGRRTVTLKDAYRLTDVINAILGELMPSVSLNSTFLLGTDPLDSSDPDEGILYITPKSNILNINYTEPAQTAPITLRQILDMLRVCYRCYWQLSYGGGYLYIEHIEWFRRGGRYTGNPTAQIDLTAKVTVRNGKYWSYQTNKYKFDKSQMPARYEFGWMDNVTIPFNGWPIDMLSNYVDQSKVDKYAVNNFDSDIDYLMLNPSGVSKDGFVIMKADILNIIDNPIALGGQNSTAVLLTYSSAAGENVYVDYDTTGIGQIAAYDTNGQKIAEIDSWDSAGGGVTTWVLPAGTEYIVVRFLDAPSTFTLNSLEPETLKVLYTNWNYNGYTDHWLQNGRLSFVYLARYYAYDMPCRNYRIGSGQYAQTLVAKGVAKNKVQDVIFPTPGYIETNRVIRTGLGDGMIKKISINLSSKMAQSTLEYDTE